MQMRYLLCVIFAVAIISPVTNTFADVQDFYFSDFTADYYLTKQDDGTYTIALKYSEIEEGFGWWPGFKFYVKETDKWLGPNKYNAVIKLHSILNLAILLSCIT